MSAERIPQESREEFPFVRPQVRLGHFIPVYGLIKYMRELEEIKGDPTDIKGVVGEFRRMKLIDIISIGASSWPEPQSRKETIEAGKTAAFHGVFVGYHMATVAIGLVGVTDLLFSAKKDK